jgi:hypothetical protein
MQRTEFMPGGYREFQKSGHGGIARRIGVKGIPGPHNWLEYFAGGLWRNWEGGKTFFMLPEMAETFNCAASRPRTKSTNTFIKRVS